MSVRCLIRSWNNACWLLRHLTKGRKYNTIATVLPQQSLARNVPGAQQAASLSSFGSVAKRILIDDGLLKASADWKKRFTTRLFFGACGPTFAFVGLSLAEGGLLTQEDEEEDLCLRIQDVVSKFPWKFDLRTPDQEFYAENVKLKDLDLGSYIAKGCSSVVYSAKLKNDYYENDFTNLMHQVESVNENEYDDYPFAVKMMFNYDIQSDSMHILNAMYKEIVPARVCHIEETITHWNQVFKKRRLKLPAHTNIAAIYNAFTDFIPEISDAMDKYPDALPTAINPEGYGRNMTLFLLMKRYQFTLTEYLENIRSPRDSVLLLAQLLEAIVHMKRHGVAHRDLKGDNILIEERCMGGSNYIPLLVVSDFGCCLADKKYGLKIPYKMDGISKGGNIRLMAPEIITQEPGMFAFLDYSKSDLWAAGALAYEIFGFMNPFDNKSGLSNFSYDDSEIPDMGGNVPKGIVLMIKNLLLRNPKSRFEPEIAANVVMMFLWAPPHWLYTKIFPKTADILDWLSNLTVKILLEGKIFDDASEMKSYKYSNPEFMLIGSFLMRVRLSEVKTALKWIQANN